MRKVEEPCDQCQFLKVIICNLAELEVYTPYQSSLTTQAACTNSICPLLPNGQRGSFSSFLIHLHPSQRTHEHHQICDYRANEKFPTMPASQETCTTLLFEPTTGWSKSPEEPLRTIWLWHSGLRQQNLSCFNTIQWFWNHPHKWTKKILRPGKLAWNHLVGRQQRSKDVPYSLTERAVGKEGLWGLPGKACLIGREEGHSGRNNWLISNLEAIFTSTPHS